MKRQGTRKRRLRGAIVAAPVLALAVFGYLGLQRSDVHAELRQRLLEAELGSAV